MDFSIKAMEVKIKGRLGSLLPSLKGDVILSSQGPGDRCPRTRIEVVTDGILARRLQVPARTWSSEMS